MEFPIPDYSDNWKIEIKSNLHLSYCPVCFPSDCIIPKKKRPGMIWRHLTPISPTPWAEKRDELFPAFQHRELQTSPMTSLSLFGVAGKLQGHSHPLDVTHPDCSLFSIEGDNESRLCFPATGLPADDSSHCFHWQRGIVNLWCILGFLFLTFPYPPNPICLCWLGTEGEPLESAPKGGKNRDEEAPPSSTSPRNSIQLKRPGSMIFINMGLDCFQGKPPGDLNIGVGEWMNFVPMSCGKKEKEGKVGWIWESCHLPNL